MWSSGFKLTLFLITLYISAVEAIIFETDDAVVIEASTETRNDRQFPFWPQGPSVINPAGISCHTPRGFTGECITMKRCFPILYSIDDHKDDTIFNGVLAEMLRNTSGSCDPYKSSNNLNHVRQASSHPIPKQHFICCSYPHKRPQRPTLKPRPIIRPRPTRPPLKVTSSTRFPSTTHKFPTHAPKPTGSPPISSDTSSSCGIPKVVGGTVSNKGKHPWIVALTNNGRQFCGGSLISKHFVLTAAHCVSHMRASDVSRIRVHLGEHTLGVGENTEQFEKVTRVLYHRSFSHRTLHNDIALLKLESPARETSYIQPVCLSRNTRTYPNTDATLAGWGQIYNNGPQATTLREVNLKIWSNEACASKYAGKSPAGIISSMICAGSAGKDACRGDSGGPLTIRNSKNVFEQIGLVSWGIGCGAYPGVYTRVASFLPWIEKNRRL